MKNLSILGIFVVDLAFFGRIPVKGETVMGDEFVTGPGGKGSNQAVAAGKAGANVSFISKIGNVLLIAIILTLDCPLKFFEYISFSISIKLIIVLCIKLFLIFS